MGRIDAKDGSSDVALEVCDSYARFPDGSECPSVRIWFFGQRNSIERVFPLLLGFLAAFSAEDFDELIRELN